MTPPDRSLLALDRPAMEALTAELGVPKYRAGQIAKNVYQRFCRTFDEMTDLPAALRAQLVEKLAWPDLKIDGM